MSKNKPDKYGNDNDQESFADVNLYLPLTDLIIPILHKLGLKPNHVTLLSTIATIYSVYCFHNKSNNCYIFYFIGYLLDCMDGRMARKYNQGSIFGMIFDLVSDNITNFPLLVSILLKVINKFQNSSCDSYKALLIFLTIIGLGFVLTVQYGINEAVLSYSKTKDDNFYLSKVKLLKENKCQDSFFGKLFLKITKQSYNSFRKVFPEKINDETIEKFKKYQIKLKDFGAGNYNLFIILCMYLLNN